MEALPGHHAWDQIPTCFLPSFLATLEIWCYLQLQAHNHSHWFPRGIWLSLHVPANTDLLTLLLCLMRFIKFITRHSIDGPKFLGRVEIVSERSPICRSENARDWLHLLAQRALGKWLPKRNPEKHQFQKEKEGIQGVLGIVPGNFILIWRPKIILLIKPKLSSLEFVFLHSDNSGDIVAIWDFVCEWQLSPQLWKGKTIRSNRLACSPHLR